MITFSKTAVSAFQHTNKALRYGQQFHQHFKLHKCSSQNDVRWCDKLYNAQDGVAKAMVVERTDITQ